MDPFHDFEFENVGIPDESSYSHVVEEIKDSFQLSAPTGTTGQWSAHIFTSPESIVQQLQVGSVPMHTYYANSVAFEDPVSGEPAFAHTYAQTHSVLPLDYVVPVQLGLVNVHAWDHDNAVLMPSVGYQLPNTQEVLADEYSKYGKRRLVGLAFEVHDTSASITRQGTLTVYRMPQTHIRGEFMAGDYTTMADSSYRGIYGKGDEPEHSNLIGPNPSHRIFNEYGLPPTSLKEAMTLKGTRQWEARKGAYVVATQDIQRNKLQFTSRTPVVFLGGDKPVEDYSPEMMQAPPIGSLFSPTFNCADNLADVSPIQEIMGPSSFPVPFHTSGVILTGLNPASTFNVTVRCIWEFAPVVDDYQVGNLVFLTRPPNVCDYEALKLYQSIASTLPPGVPVDMNAKGDFWDMILSGAQKALPTLGGMFFGPQGRVVGSLVGSGLAGIQSRRNAKAENKDALMRAQMKNLNLAPVDGTNFNPHYNKPKKTKTKKRSGTQSKNGGGANNIWPKYRMTSAGPLIQERKGAQWIMAYT